MKYFISFILLCLVNKVYSQSSYATAHFRSYHVSFNALGESRIGKILLAPEASLKLLNGRLELAGHYAFQAGNSRIEVNDYDENLVGNNINRRSKWYEGSIGVNFFKFFQRGKYVFLFSRGGPHIRYDFYGPGTRAFLGGIRAGCGGFLYHIYGYQGNVSPFLLRNADGLTIPEGGTSNSIYQRPMFANVITEYLFAGIRLHYTSKGDMYYQTHRGGSVAVLSLDLLLPNRLEVGKMYSNDGMGYTPVPKEGQNWKTPGYRLVLDAYPTSVMSWYVRWEGGKMPHFDDFLPIPESYYMNIMVGFHISPKAGYVGFKGN